MTSLGAFIEQGGFRSALPILAIAALVLTGYAFFGWGSTIRVGVGDPAPDFALPVIYNGDDGDVVKLSNLEGETVVLLFWASWCGPCRATVPAVEKVWGRLGENGVTVIGVNTRDTPEKALAYAQKARVSFPIVSDADGSVGASFGVSSYPTIVVINKDGVVAGRRSGAMDAGSLESYVLSLR